MICAELNCPYNEDGECDAFRFGNVDCNNPDYIKEINRSETDEP